MALFQSIRRFNVVGGQSSPVIDIDTTSTSTTLTVNTGIIYLSVGDSISITDNDGGAYTVGQVLTISSINYGAGTIVVNTADATGVSNVLANITNWNTNSIANASGYNSSEAKDVITCERAQTSTVTNGITVNAGASATLPSFNRFAVPTNVEYGFILDAVYTTAGVASPNSIIQILGYDSSASLNNGLPLANLKQGDVFYTSSISETFYDTGATATDTIVSLFAKNTTGANLILFFRAIGSSR